MLIKEVVSGIGELGKDTWLSLIHPKRLCVRRDWVERKRFEPLRVTAWAFAVCLLATGIAKNRLGEQAIVRTFSHAADDSEVFINGKLALSRDTEPVLAPVSWMQSFSIQVSTSEGVTEQLEGRGDQGFVWQRDETMGERTYKSLLGDAPDIRHVVRRPITRIEVPEAAIQSGRVSFWFNRLSIGGGFTSISIDRIVAEKIGSSVVYLIFLLLCLVLSVSVVAGVAVHRWSIETISRAFKVSFVTGSFALVFFSALLLLASLVERLLGSSSAVAGYMLASASVLPLVLIARLVWVFYRHDFKLSVRECCIALFTGLVANALIAPLVFVPIGMLLLRYHRALSDFF